MIHFHLGECKDVETLNEDTEVSEFTKGEGYDKYINEKDIGYYKQ